jgi:hypothetical protein
VLSGEAQEILNARIPVGTQLRSFKTVLTEKPATLSKECHNVAKFAQRRIMLKDAAIY